MQMQLYTFLNGSDKISVAAMNTTDAQEIAFNLCELNAMALVMLPYVDTDHWLMRKDTGDTIH